MSQKRGDNEREQALREWLGSSRLRWALYRTVYYGVRVLGSLALLATAYLLDTLLPRSVEWGATVVCLWWVHHFDAVSRDIVAKAKLRETLARQRMWLSLMARGAATVGAILAHWKMRKRARGTT